MTELDTWLDSEDDDIPWITDNETPFRKDEPNMPIEKFLEHRGVKHLRDLLELVK